jgi:PAS domain S-box-containing protein
MNSGHPKSNEELLTEISVLESRQHQLQQQKEDLARQVRALKDLSHIHTWEKALETLPAILTRFMECNAAWVLSVDPNGKITAPIRSSDAEDAFQWSMGPVFERVLDGETVNAFDVTQLKEWNQPAANNDHPIRSAVHLNLSSGDHRRILILAHPDPSPFSTTRVKSLADLCPAILQMLEAVEADTIRDDSRKLRSKHDLAAERVHFLEEATASMGLVVVDVAAARLIDANRQFFSLLGGQQEAQTWARHAAPLLAALDGRSTHIWVRDAAMTFHPYRVTIAASPRPSRFETDARVCFVERAAHRANAEIHEQSSGELKAWASNAGGRVLAMTPGFYATVRDTFDVDLLALVDDAPTDSNPNLARAGNLWSQLHKETVKAGNAEKSFDAFVDEKRSSFRLIATRVHSAESASKTLVSGALEDLSWSHLRADDLEDTQSILASVVQTALDSIISIDHESRVIEWNPAAEETFGYARSDALGRPLGDLIIPPEFRAAHKKGMERFLSTGEHKVLRQRIELEALHASGHRFPVEMSISPVMVQGRPIFTANLRNIERRVETQRALEVAREKAERTNREKTLFLGMVSHEIRTPMNLVTGLLELAQSSVAGEEKDQYLNTALNNARSLLALFNDLLESIRLETTDFQLHLRSFRVREVLNDSLEGLARAVGERPVLVMLDVSPKVPQEIQGDPDRLRQIVTNLMHNALKVTGEGVVELRVGVQSEASPPALTFQVIDTGPGFSGDAEKLFERFHRADDASHPIRSGTGLGLSITRTLVEKMGGVISAELRKNLPGTVFSFSLPLQTSSPAEEPASVGAAQSCVLVTSNPLAAAHLEAALKRRGVAVGSQGSTTLMDVPTFELTSGDRPRAHADRPSGQVLSFKSGASSIVDVDDLIDRLSRVSAPSAIEEDRLPSKPSAPHRSARILVVEDNPENGLLLKRMLSSEARDAELVPSGQEAVSRCRTANFDLVLMDIDLPEMDGIETTRLLQANRQAKGLEPLCVVFYTAHGTERKIQEAYAVGGSGFLTKPLPMAELRSALDAWLDGKPRILVLDDQIENLSVVQNRLEKAGFAVDVTTRQGQAMDWLLGRPYVLALVDLEMPNMTGTTFAEKMRSLVPQLPPLFAFTAHEPTEVQQGVLDAGFSGVWSKSLSGEELRKRVARVVEGREDSEIQKKPAQKEDRVDEDVLDLAIAYLSGLDVISESLRRNFELGDWEGIRKLGHNIKGSAGTYGLLSLSRIGGDLETCGQTEKGDGFLEMVDALERRSRELRDELESRS